jgi:hypothetical protein
MAFLAGQADDHDEADLGVYIVLHSAEPQSEEGPEDGNGEREEDTEGQRPALVLRGKNQEHKEKREPEDSAGGHALGGFLLLKRHPKIVEAHAIGHRLGENSLQGFHRLASAVARGDRCVDL